MTTSRDAGVPALNLFDSHAHLTSEALNGQVRSVLERCAAEGVRRVVSIGSNVADSERALELARQFTSVFATAGIHPHEAGRARAGDVGRVTELLKQDKVVALGEIGLDYHYDFSEPARQREVFRLQLDATRPFNLPAVIHCRDALDDTISTLVDSGYRDRPVVFHCFTGSPEDARRIADHGWRISFTGIVTFNRSRELQAIARRYPEDRLMIETDSPYLSPVPVRHIRPNEPSHLVHTARFLSELRATPLEQLARQMTENTCRFYGIEPPREG